MISVALVSDKNIKRGECIYTEYEKDKFMIANFKNITPTTITAVGRLNSTLDDIDFLSLLIEVRDPTKKIKDGEIQALVWRGLKRGDRSSKDFVNSCCMYVKPVGKPRSVNIKIGRGKRIPGKDIKEPLTEDECSKIQMTGCLSIKMGVYVVNSVLHEIEKARELLVYILDNLETFKQSILWIVSTTETMESNYDSDFIYDKCANDTEIGEDLRMMVLRILAIINDLQGRPIDEVTERLFEICYLFCSGKNNEVLPPLNTEEEKSNYCKSTHLSFLGRSMVNCNYYMGFKIDRKALLEILREEKYNVDYSNTMYPYVKLIISSTIKNDEFVIRKPKKSCQSDCSSQSFTINRSGHIMHSGQGGAAMADCYHHVIAKLISLKDRIKLVE